MSSLRNTPGKNIREVAKEMKRKKELIKKNLRNINTDEVVEKIIKSIK